MLFNAGLEMAIRSWKSKLDDHGLLIGGLDQASRLTNVRFADDLIIYSTDEAELADMLDMLAEELAKVGLTMNSKKCKIFTTSIDSVSCCVPLFLDAAGGFIEILRANDSHKYLGCLLPGDLRQRGRANLQYRLRCAWGKFHEFKRALTDKYVDVKLRLRLFDAVVTPCALYGLTTSPLTAKDEEQLATTQRKMLRLIIGYVKGDGDSWADMYRRLRLRLASAMAKKPVKEWVLLLKQKKQSLLDQITSGARNSLTCRLAAWRPDLEKDWKLCQSPCRGRGRPRAVWRSV